MGFNGMLATLSTKIDTNSRRIEAISRAAAPDDVAEGIRLRNLLHARVIPGNEVHAAN
jgi:hypothetical protein